MALLQVSRPGSEGGVGWGALGVCTFTLHLCLLSPVCVRVSVSLLVELSPLPVDDTVKEHFADPEGVFEAAVHSQTNSSDRKLVWKE